MPAKACWIGSNWLDASLAISTTAGRSQFSQLIGLLLLRFSLKFQSQDTTHTRLQLQRGCEIKILVLNGWPTLEL